jgi:hypothetical protein
MMVTILYLDIMMSPAYSRVFDNDGIGELNANPGKLKLI